MAKLRKVYFCTACGNESPKWVGKCPACGQWNTYAEEPTAVASGGGVASRFAAARGTTERAQAVAIEKVEKGNIRRIDLLSPEVNRVLGGGLVPGSMVLLGGEPGIGKSTLALQIAIRLTGTPILYVSGEESPEQIKMRADRLGIQNPECLVLAETSLENILLCLAETPPELLIVDSIQTLYSERIDSSPGNVSQVRECAAMLLRYAKESGVPVLIIGHITKEGSIAGPKVLEHIADVVLQFEGDGNYAYRILRGVKNRFGATSEIGVFEMREEGLREVGNPSEILVSHYDEPLSGVAIGATIEGVRPFLLETQALVSHSAYGTPQRAATGVDYKRLNMLLAVLEKRLGFKLGTKDVFLNLAGGFKASDTGLDLAIIAAIISSGLDISLGSEICFAGEVGLSGEVRPAARTEQRVAEAARLGFGTIVVSGYARKALKTTPKGIEVVYVNRVDELARKLFGKS